jgi:hypothetical protein
MVIKKASASDVLNLDADGTPLHNGERLAEIRPGQWVTALDAAVLAFFEQMAGEQKRMAKHTQEEAL